MRRGTVAVVALAASMSRSVDAQIAGTPFVAGPGSSPRLDLGHPFNEYQGDFFTPPDALLLGGGDTNNNRSQIIRGSPYGDYDAGTLLSLWATNRAIFANRAPISGGQENASQASATFSQDSALIAEVAMNDNPRLSVPPVSWQPSSHYFNGNFVSNGGSMYVETALQGTSALAGGPSGTGASIRDGTSVWSYVGPQTVLSYDSTHVYFKPSLPEIMRRHLRLNMYVNSNSIDTALPARYAAKYLPTPTSTTRPTEYSLPNDYFAMTTAIAADGSGVTVSGWTVEGANKGVATPSVVPGNYTISAGHSTPFVAFGAPRKVFGQNFYAAYNPLDVANNGDSRIKEYENIEIDLNNLATTDYAASFHGDTCVYVPQGRVPNSAGTPTPNTDGVTHAILPTDDSYCLNILGGNALPTLIRVSQAGVVQVWGDGYWLDGHALTSPGIEAGSRKLNTVWEQAIDTNRQRLAIWGQRDVAGGAGGWPNASMHLGLVIDGPTGSLPSNPVDQSHGSPRGEVIFDPPNFAGGVCLSNYTEVLGLCVDNNGNAVAKHSLGVSGGFAADTAEVSGAITGLTMTYTGIHPAITRPPTLVASVDTGWRSCLFASSWCAGIASATEYTMLGGMGWFSVGSALPANDATATAPDAGAAWSVNGSTAHEAFKSAAPRLSSCGIGPSLDATASDAGGTVTPGSGGPATCTVTFSSAYATAPHCSVSGYASGSFYFAAKSATAFTVAMPAGAKFDYVCRQ